MPTTRCLRLAALTFLVLVRLADATTVAQKCTSSKVKAAGKETGAKMVCHAKAKKAVTAVDANCLLRAKTKADATIDKAGVGCAQGVAVDGSGNVYVSDSYRIQKFACP